MTSSNILRKFICCMISIINTVMKRDVSEYQDILMGENDDYYDELDRGYTFLSQVCNANFYIDNYNKNKKNILTNYYTIIFTELKNELKRHILIYKEKLITFSLIHYEEQWYEFYEYSNILKDVCDIIYEYAKDYFKEDDRDPNSINILETYSIKSICIELWDELIIKEYYSLLEKELLSIIHKERVDTDYIVTFSNFNIIYHFKEVFTQYSKRLYTNYITYIETYYISKLKDKHFTLTNIIPHINSYITAFKKEKELDSKYNISALYHSDSYSDLNLIDYLEQSLKDIFIYKFFDIIKDICIKDIKDESYCIIPDIFNHYIELFPDYNVFKTECYTTLEKLYFKNSDIIGAYITLRYYINIKCSNDKIMIDHLNEMMKTEFTLNTELATRYIESVHYYLSQSKYAHPLFNIYSLELITQSFLDRDILEALYKKYLAKRLLSNKYDYNKELLMLTHLKKMDFDGYSQCLVMIKDMKTNNYYHKEMILSLDPMIDYSFKIGTEGIWPLKGTTVIKCNAFNPIKKSIENYYDMKCMDRKKKLTWCSSLLTCTMDFNGHSLTMKYPYVDFLLEYNTKDSVLKSEYSKLDVKKLLKLGIIKENKDSYLINDTWTYKHKHIKL